MCVEPVLYKRIIIKRDRVVKQHRKKVTVLRSFFPAALFRWTSCFDRNRPQLLLARNYNYRLNPDKIDFAQAEGRIQAIHDRIGNCPYKMGDNSLTMRLILDWNAKTRKNLYSLLSSYLLCLCYSGWHDPFLCDNFQLRFWNSSFEYDSRKRSS